MNDYSNKIERTSNEEHQKLINSEVAEVSVEMLQNAVESNLCSDGSSARIAEKQVSLNSDNATNSCPITPALEVEGELYFLSKYSSLYPT